VSHVGDDGSALSSEVRRALILHCISAIHEEVLELVAPEYTNAHAMSVATSAFSLSVTGTKWLESSLSLKKPNEAEIKAARDMSEMTG